MKQERLSAAESANAIKDRKIDAFFWVGGVRRQQSPISPPRRIKIRLSTTEVVDAMNKKYGPLYAKGVISGSYSGQDKPNANIDVWNILVRATR
jgi:TRAP-type uncharacterized transport system substrate-binding protein